MVISPKRGSENKKKKAYLRSLEAVALMQGARGYRGSSA